MPKRRSTAKQAKNKKSKTSDLEQLKKQQRETIRQRAEAAIDSLTNEGTSGNEMPAQNGVLAAVNGHHPPKAPYLKLPSLDSIGRATPKKCYYDDDIVHTGLSYEDEAPTYDRTSWSSLIGMLLGVYLAWVVGGIIIPQYIQMGSKCPRPVVPSNCSVQLWEYDAFQICSEEQLNGQFGYLNKTYKNEQECTIDFVLGLQDHFKSNKRIGVSSFHPTLKPLTYLYTKFMLKAAKATKAVSRNEMNSGSQ